MFLRTVVLATAILFGSVGKVQATDLSDLWWNSSENGWGVNVVQEGTILFLTFYIYGPSGNPYWVSASSTQYQGTNAAGGQVFIGPLYETSGPWFGTFFNPGFVVPNQVGSVTFTVNTVNTATVTYNVGVTSVTKEVTRLAFRANPSIPGNYFGGVVGDVSSCPLPSNNGHFEGEALLSISGTTANYQITLQASGGTCVMNGPYSQAGRMGRVLGTISCSTGVSGTVDAFEVEANNSAISSRYQAAYSNGCRETGRFAGVRR